MTALDLGPLTSAADDFRQAIARLDDAAGDAETAWQQLPTALDSRGTQLAAGAYVGPAHQLARGLLEAADKLSGTLLTTAGPLRSLSAQADAHPNDPSWAARITASEASCAAAITSITGGEAGSVHLPSPAPPAGGGDVIRPASVVLPIAPLGAALPRFGAAVLDGAAAAEGLVASGLLGVLGLVLSLGGSTDSVTAAPAKKKISKARPRAGEPARITPYQPCSPLEHGDGCEERHLLVEKPGDEPFTGDKVRGDEAPGEMPGTKSDWTKERADNDRGWVYKAPDQRTMRVVEPGWDPRYPNGDVVFTNAKGQPLRLDGQAHGTPDELHIVRNPNGSFPIPKGWNE